VNFHLKNRAAGEVPSLGFPDVSGAGWFRLAVLLTLLLMAACAKADQPNTTWDFQNAGEMEIVIPASPAKALNHQSEPVETQEDAAKVLQMLLRRATGRDIRIVKAGETNPRSQKLFVGFGPHLEGRVSPPSKPEAVKIGRAGRRSLSHWRDCPGGHQQPAVCRGSRNDVCRRNFCRARARLSFPFLQPDEPRALRSRHRHRRPSNPWPAEFSSTEPAEIFQPATILPRIKICESLIRTHFVPTERIMKARHHVPGHGTQIPRVLKGRLMQGESLPHRPLVILHCIFRKKRTILILKSPHAVVLHEMFLSA